MSVTKRGSLNPPREQIQIYGNRSETTQHKQQLEKKSSLEEPYHNTIVLVIYNSS